jgi:hypothetical protein
VDTVILLFNEGNVSLSAVCFHILRTTCCQRLKPLPAGMSSLLKGTKALQETKSQRMITMLKGTEALQETKSQRMVTMKQELCTA